MTSVGTNPLNRAERDGVKARNCALKYPSPGMQAEIWRPPGQWRSSNSAWEGLLTPHLWLRSGYSGLMKFLSSLSPSYPQKQCNCKALAPIAYRNAQTALQTLSNFLLFYHTPGQQRTSGSQGPTPVMSLTHLI